MNVIQNINTQSTSIAKAVHEDEKNVTAGDQGLMFGYATNEWDTVHLHPLSHYLANQLCMKYAELRKNGELAWARPDMKSQVIIKYKKIKGMVKPISVYNILMSCQHDPNITQEEIRKDIREKVIKKVVPEEYLTEDSKFIINPSENFEVGGPEADAGLTGRKIVVDTYGGWCPHGGGAFSGKDPTKVDRSAAYYGRFVAKSLVAAGLAQRVLIQVSYAIGLAEPLSIYIDSYGTVKESLTDEDLMRIVRKNFDFQPGSIIKELNLRRPIYQKTAKYGHFGREDPDFTWEHPKTDLILD
jgi:S-adenosylmethionine synthetase